MHALNRYYMRFPCVRVYTHRFWGMSLNVLITRLRSALYRFARNLNVMKLAKLEVKLDIAVRKLQNLLDAITLLKRRLSVYAAAVTTHRVRDLCPICLDPLTEDASYKIPCGHSFHVVCIFSWLGKEPICPTCRCPCSELTN